MLQCTDVHEFMGSALDGVLPDNVQQQFRHHIEACTPCRNAFELELLAKRIVRGHVSRVPTPQGVFESVVRTIRHEAPASTSEGWLNRFFRTRFLAPAVAVGVAAVVMMWMVSPKSSTDLEALHTAPNDVINQSIVNFALIRSGEMKPAVVSCYPEGVVGFFERNNARFAVHVKSLDDCDWYGAISTEYAGVSVAHVMYHVGDEVLYVYQVDRKEVGAASKLGLPPAAMAALTETGWYTDPTHPGCNVVLWTTEAGTLCAAVSTMSKDRLLALLTTR
jgi:hypothetical protein